MEAAPLITRPPHSEVNGSESAGPLYEAAGVRPSSEERSRSRADVNTIGLEALPVASISEPRETTRTSEAVAPYRTVPASIVSLAASPPAAVPSAPVSIPTATLPES